MNMKTLACLTASLAATAALADIEVQVGVTEVTSAYTNTIVAVPYSGFDSSNITVSNVVKTANLVAGDMCYAMSSTAGLYDAWELKSNAGVLYWDKTTQVQVKQNGEVVTATSPSAGDTTLTPGSALWICRKGTRSAALNTTPFYLWGQYTGSAPSTTVSAPAAGAWNLVANCGSTAITVADLITKIGANAKAGDQIVVPNEKFGIVFYRGSSAWGASKYQSTTIQPGMGCWLFAKSGTKEDTSFTITW